MIVQYYIVQPSKELNWNDKSRWQKVDSFKPAEDKRHWTQGADEIIKAMKYIHQTQDLASKWDEIVEANK